MIYDAHFHWGDWGSAQFAGRTITPILNMRTIADLESYFNQIDKGIVVPQLVARYTDDKPVLDGQKVLAYQDAIVDFCERTEGARFAVYVHPFEPWWKRTIDNLERMADHPKIRAVKMHPNFWPNASADPNTWDGSLRERMEVVFEIVRRRNLVLQFHTGKSGAVASQNYAALVKSYPEFKYHFVHMGCSSKGHYVFVPLFCRLIEEGYHVWADTCWARGFAVRWIVSELAKIDALDRLLFASDEPWGDFPSESHKILGLKIDEEIKRKILYDNAEKLYG